MKKPLISFALVVAVGVLALVAWDRELGLPGLDETGVAEVQELPVPGCDPLIGPCVAGGEQGLGLYLKPPLVPLKSFEVVVTSSLATPLESVVVDFQMLGMSMGMNRFILQRVPGETSHWQGTAMLPVCVSGRSDWVAEVLVSQGDGQVKARFPFSLER